MSGNQPTQTTISFGPFEANLQTQELRKHGTRLRLPGQSFQILRILVAKPGQLVTREELQEALWPSDTYVDFEHGVNAAVNRLREALNDSADSPQIIETLPRRGYRFIASIEENRPGPLSTVRTRTQIGVWLGLSAIVVLVFGLLALTGGWRARVLGGHQPKPVRKMVAVLPFEDLSNNPDQEYFCDGLTEELISQLGEMQPSSLGVIARGSVMRYRHGDRSLQHVARDLGVQYVVEGSVRRDAGQVRITVELIDVGDLRHIWGHSYDADLGGILGVQENVSQSIVQALQLKLDSAGRASPLKARPANPKAHDFYLRGRYFWNQRTEDGLHKAIELYQKAIEIEPNYAAAYSGLADCYGFAEVYGHMTPREDTRAKTLAAAQRSVQLDDGLAEAHNSLAGAMWDNWDWSGSEIEFRRSLALNPSYAAAHFWFAEFLAQQGHSEESIIESRLAVELDPFSLINLDGLGGRLYYARQYDEAIHVFQNALEMDPNFTPLHWDLGLVYDQKGSSERAVSEMHKAVQLSNRDPEYLAALGYIYARSGRRSKARKILAELEELQKRRYIPGYFLALVYAGLGETEESLRSLEEAYEHRSFWLSYLKVDPRLDSLRSDPRFLDIVRRVGLPSSYTINRH
jgi:TolB-like protein/DNA-binding winged helix-turn-helix (wHTH) protein/tetratricopeptide (TPR) repeat protein